MLAPKPPAWNIFARELEAILATRGRSFGYLANLALYQSDGKPLVHAQKLDLLRQSLYEPTKYPTMLNPQQLAHVSEVLEFSPEEQHRLRAAILATAVQSTLYEREIAPEQVLKAAEAVFQIILGTWQPPPNDDPFQGVRHLKEKAGRNTTQQGPWSEITATINHAILAWHLSQGSGDDQELLNFAYQAQAGFRLALDQLQQVPEHDEQWDLWQQEAQEGAMGVIAVIDYLKHNGA